MGRWVHHFRRSAVGLARAGLGLLFPPRCGSCDADLAEIEDDLLLCADCRLLLGPKIWPCCPACGAAGQPEGDCPWCRKAPLKFDSVIPLGGYREGLNHVVLRMKRPTHDGLSMAMGRLLAARRGRELAEFEPDLIVPIPLFWLRRLQLQTNSAEIVAECLGRFLGVPVRRRLLVRSRNTLPQKGLRPRARFRNVRGAFAVRSSRHLEGSRVLLVDDTLTTGATCSEASRTLKQAGAERVAVAVIARAQGADPT